MLSIVKAGVFLNLVSIKVEFVSSLDISCLIEILTVVFKCMIIYIFFIRLYFRLIYVTLKDLAFILG